MDINYRNIYLNLNSKGVEVDFDKYNKRVEELKNGASSDSKDVLQHRLDILKAQVDDLKVCTFRGQSFKEHRRVQTGDLLDDRYFAVILEDVCKVRHQNMYYINLTKNLALVLAYTFNLDYLDTKIKLEALCELYNTTMESISYCLLSQSGFEILKCEIPLGDLWGMFPEIKKYLSELCKMATENDRPLIDCVTNTTYSDIISISADDEERQLLTSLSLKLILEGQNIIQDCLKKVDSLKSGEISSIPTIYSQFICGCIFGVHGYTPDSFTVYNRDNIPYIIEIEKY